MENENLGLLYKMVKYSMKFCFLLIPYGMAKITTSYAHRMELNVILVYVLSYAIISAQSVLIWVSIMWIIFFFV